MTRQEHMDWCKKRVLAYCDTGETQNAFASMVSDLGKHPDTAGHMGLEMGASLLMMGDLSSSDDMRKFIEGFN